MRNLLFIFLLFLLGGCSSEPDLAFNEDYLIPAIFSLDNSVETQQKSKHEQNSMVLAKDNNSISISMEQEAWCSKKIQVQKEKTSWTNPTNKVTWITGDQIGIFMRDAAGSNSYARDNVLYSVVTGGASTASLTASATPLYFPNKTSNVKFYAYYPYSATSNSLLVNYTLPANQSTTQALGSADIMYASTGSHTGAAPNIALNFNHQMTLLTFNIKGGLLSGLFTLTQVTVNGAAITNTGTLDLSTGILTPNTSNTFTATVNTSQSVSSSAIANVDVIINPCVITGNSALLASQLKVTLTFSGLGLVHSTNLITSGTFVKGTRYVYNLTVAL